LNDERRRNEVIDTRILNFDKLEAENKRLTDALEETDGILANIEDIAHGEVGTAITLLRCRVQVLNHCKDKGE